MNTQEEEPLRRAVCSCGQTSWGNGKRSGKVFCWYCSKEWSGESGSYPDGANVSLNVYPNWYYEIKK